MSDKVRKHFESIQEAISGRKYEEAEALATRIVQPHERFFVLGAIRNAQKDYAGAEGFFKRSLADKPGNEKVVEALSTVYLSQARYPDAIDEISKLKARYSEKQNYALIHVSALVELDRFEEAEVLMDELLGTLKSPEYKTLVAACQIKRGLLKPEESITLINRARELFPEKSAEFDRHEAEALSELDLDLASDAFDKLDGPVKERVSVLWNSAFSKLRQGKFDIGWDLYEYGLNPEVGKNGRPVPQNLRRIGLVTDLDGLDTNKYLVLLAEQGVGDQVIFYSLLRELSENFKKLMLISEERMIPILVRSFPEIEVISYGFAQTLYGQRNRLSGIFPVGSLMKHYRASIGDFNKTAFPYIVANSRVSEKYREKLGNVRPNAKKIVGISWTGGFWKRQIKAKSIQLSELATLLNPDFCYVCLQYGDLGEAKEYVRQMGLPVIFVDNIDFRKDLDGWLSIINACDEILSVSTALVHFAAAIGKKVNLLLTDYQSPFIWGRQEGISYMYPTVYIHRKSKNESMAEFINKVKQKIESV